MDHAGGTIDENSVFQENFMINCAAFREAFKKAFEETFNEAIESSCFLATNSHNPLSDLVTRSLVAPPGLEDVTPEEHVWCATAAFQSQWDPPWQGLIADHQSVQCLHPVPNQRNNRVRVRKPSKKPVEPGLVVPKDPTVKEPTPKEPTVKETAPKEPTVKETTPEEPTPDLISDPSHQESLHLQPRENKGMHYYQMLIEFFRVNSQPAVLLTFNLKGRDINRDRVALTLQLTWVFIKLAEMLFENNMHLLGAPTIDRDKPWVNIPVICWQVPFCGKHFLDIETRIRDTLKEVLKSHLKPSDRIQMKEMSYIPPDQYAFYVTNDPTNVGSSGHRNGMCRPCQNIIDNGTCRYGDSCTFCHFPLHKKKTVSTQKKELEDHQSSMAQSSTDLPCPDNAQSSMAQSSKDPTVPPEATTKKKTVCDQEIKMERILKLLTERTEEEFAVNFEFKTKVGPLKQENPNDEHTEKIRNFLNGFGFEFTGFQPNEKVQSNKRGLSRRTILTKVHKIQNIRLDTEEKTLEFERSFRSIIKEIFIDTVPKTVTDDDTEKSSEERHRLQLCQIVIQKDGKDIDWLQKPLPLKNSSQSSFCSQCCRSCACNAQSKC